MIGKTFSNVIASENELTFIDNDKKYKFHHNQDCCESVCIEEIHGDIIDLIGNPILYAEEISSNSNDDYGIEKWTFYKFATIKGSVTVRWYGSSNGYYGINVDFDIE